MLIADWFQQRFAKILPNLPNHKVRRQSHQKDRRLPLFRIQTNPQNQKNNVKMWLIGHPHRLPRGLRSRK